MPLVVDLLMDPFAGEEWKKSGEEVGGFCDVSCDTLFARGVSCDPARKDACDASDRNWSSGP